MKLNFLAAGRVRMKKSIYIPGADRSETIDLPVSSALIRHKQGNVLFDTGCHPSVVDHADERWGPLARLMKPIMTADETLLPSLACVGLGLDDIDIVVNSHFHPDHCGCNQFFSKATILAHASELEAAKAQGAEAAGYLRADWDFGRPVEAVTGEKDLFGDASVGRGQPAAKPRYRYRAAQHLECGGAAEVVRGGEADREVRSGHHLRP
jgi:N-acyl homoserine lactone hydrolase